MNAEERTLIAGLFERLRGAEGAYRDPDADALIREQIDRQPHAPYAMAQTLIVQNQALEAAQKRIAELERSQQETRTGTASPSPWGPRAAEAMGAPAGFGRPPANGDAPYRDQPYPPSSYNAPVGQPSQGGGFLSGALQTAAGVAGGALLFSGIQSLFSGGGHEAAAGDAAKAADLPTGDEAGADGGSWFSGLLGDGAPAESGDVADAGGDDGGWV